MLREALRRAGLRPVQLCVPDTRRAGFDERCRAQCLRVAAPDEIDQPLHALMREAAQDLEGWAA
ncbi:MAG: antitoxin MazE-like protein [Rubrivivax sp.]